MKHRYKPVPRQSKAADDLRALCGRTAAAMSRGFSMVYLPQSLERSVVSRSGQVWVAETLYPGEPVTSQLGV